MDDDRDISEEDSDLSEEDSEDDRDSKKKVGLIVPVIVGSSCSQPLPMWLFDAFCSVGAPLVHEVLLFV